MYFKEFQGQQKSLAWFSCIQRADAIHISRELLNASGQGSCWWPPSAGRLCSVIGNMWVLWGPCSRFLSLNLSFVSLVCWWPPAGSLLWGWAVPANEHAHLSPWCFRAPESTGRNGRGLSDSFSWCILLLFVFLWGWEDTKSGFKSPCTELPRQNNHEHWK